MFKKKSEEKFKELEKKLEEKYIGLENEFKTLRYSINELKKYIQIIIKNEDEEIKYSFVVHDDKAIQIDENIDFSKYDFEGEF